MKLSKIPIFAAFAVALSGAAQATVITFNDFESETGTSSGTLPAGFTFFGSGGDMPGGGVNQGISDANPLSGSYSYVVDHTHTTPGAG